MQHGKFYGIGVGPGDPELMTIKAARIIERVDVVFAAQSTKNDYSQALANARPYLKEQARIVTLGFPMSRDERELAAAWNENAALVVRELKAGFASAFLTLGDPLLYSTFTYLYRAVRAIFPEVDCEIVPGVTSFQAAAALTGSVLAEQSENLFIASGVGCDDRLEKTLAAADNAVILKTYRQFDHICDVLDERGLKENSILVSCCGLENQRVERNLDALRGEKIPYLSLLLVKKNKSWT
ncbi:MAG: precorrin-2 C(20)-methyltransferase [Pseudomonadota bacterium]